MGAIHAGTIRGMYIMGENPAMSDPDVQHAREALAALEHLVVQEIFLTETAYHADVILPATAFPEKDGTFTNTDRRVQLGRRALEPPGDARPDWWVVQEIALRLGLGWGYQHPRDVFAELRSCMPSIRGISWDRLEREGAVTYPCDAEDEPGREVIFGGGFPTPSARQARAGVGPSPRRDARRRLPLRPDDRSPPGALAHRVDDPPLGGARRPRTRGGGAPLPARASTAWACGPATRCGWRRAAAPSR